MSLLRFEDIRLDFGEQIILRDAEFSIEPGERVCLIGRNGAGKSTTLKLIMGEIEPDQGEIIPKASGNDRQPATTESSRRHGPASARSHSLRAA